jgi:hypothetical protein
MNELEIDVFVIDYTKTHISYEFSQERLIDTIYSKGKIEFNLQVSLRMIVEELVLLPLTIFLMNHKYCDKSSNYPWFLVTYVLLF